MTSNDMTWKYIRQLEATLKDLADASLKVDSTFSLLWHRKTNTTRQSFDELGIRSYEIDHVLGRLRRSYEAADKLLDVKRTA